MKMTMPERIEIASIFMMIITPRSALLGTKNILHCFSSHQSMVSKPIWNMRSQISWNSTNLQNLESTISTSLCVTTPANGNAHDGHMRVFFTYVDLAVIVAMHALDKCNKPLNSIHLQEGTGIRATTAVDEKRSTIAEHSCSTMKMVEVHVADNKLIVPPCTPSPMYFLFHMSQDRKTTLRCNSCSTFVCSTHFVKCRPSYR